MTSEWLQIKLELVTILVTYFTVNSTLDTHFAYTLDFVQLLFRGHKR
jgi:uncharacterized membrane protein